MVWGRFNQSQRLYELQVEDGETELQPAERSEHRIVSFEHELERFGAGPLLFRVELYERRIRGPRVRYENLFDPISTIPELESDRIRIAPTSSRARGVELLFQGHATRDLDWIWSYSYAEVFDHLEGERVPRGIDQPHTIALALRYRTPWHWQLDLTAEVHTGWPTTAVTARSVDGEIVPELGPLYGERLPDYRRLDLRASRAWQAWGGELSFFVSLQNLTDEENVRGYAVRFEEVPSEGGPSGVRTVLEPEHWGGILPNLGLRFRF
jgi:hypothetical protein